MANQMIALQARAPQAPGLGSAIQQNAQVINMLAQQKVAERQALQAQQKMALEAELAGPQLAKAKSEAFSAEQKALTDFFDVAAKVIGLSKSPEDVQFGANMLKQRFDNPLFTQMIDQTIKDMPADPQAFGAWRNRTKLETLDAKDQVPYFFEQVKSKELIGESGDVGVLTTGGVEGGPTIKMPRTLVPETRKREVTVSEPTFEDGGVGGPVSADDAVADLAGGIASARNDREYQDALDLLGQTNPDMAASVRRAMPRFDPARIEGIRAEFSRAFGGQAGASLVAGDRGGMGGPDEGYVEAPTPFRAKNPMQAPMPGSAIVPLKRLGAEKETETRASKKVELEADIAKSKSDQQRGARNFFKVSGVDLRTGKDPVAALIKRSTSGAIEAIGAEAKGALPEMLGGGATPGSEAIGELEAIGATITNNLLGGKLGTGISNEDRKMIERMVGDIANPYIPAGKRLAAWNRVKKIQASYLDNAPTATPTRAAPAQRRTPVSAGKPPAGVSAQDWKYMTPQERALWQK
jgi:hypothetical protein